MKRTLRISMICAILALSALSTFGQSRPLVGTVIDVDQGRNQMQIEADNQSGSRITIETDAVSTVYRGFGTVIEDKPEIFTGSAGLANVRLGDRVEVRGTDRSEGVLVAQEVRLLGRDVPAPQVGVGQTRNPTSVSTPATPREAAEPQAAIVGTIRQANAEEGRLLVETTDRRMITIRTYRNTQVRYRGETYPVSNLENGDRIRIQVDPRDRADEDISARSIEVVSSVREEGSGTVATVTILEGRITRIDSEHDYVYVERDNDAGRGGEMRVDVHDAEDAEGGAIHARDLRIGDRVEMSGSYGRDSGVFLASTVRFGSGIASNVGERSGPVAYGLITIRGTINNPLGETATLAVLDSETDRITPVWAADDLIIRTKEGGYAAARSLRTGDSAEIRAFRDPDGNLIAQTVRLRNR